MTDIASLTDELISLLKIDLPDDFYSLPENERTKKLNEMFPTWLASLSSEKKARVHEILKPSVDAKMRKIEAYIVQKLIKEIQLEHAAELSTTIKFTSPQEYKLDVLRESVDGSPKKKKTPTTVRES